MSALSLTTGDPLEHSRIDFPREKRSLFCPGWPFVWLFMGYPLWWALGITWLASLCLTVAMAVELARLPRIRAPRHFGWWLLFLAWVVASVLLVQVDAPGAEAGGGGLGRYLTWTVRFVTFIEGSVLALYLCTMLRRVSTQRILRVLSWMFVYIVIGGLLGVAAPHFQFTSLAEYVLPGRLSNNAFVQSFVHPAAAQIQTHLGRESIRPSAPFPYANDWGLNYVCFVPFFTYTWSHARERILRIGMPFVLILSAIPVVYSLNRAMWATLALMAAFVAVRAAIRGHTKILVAIVIGVCCAGLVVTASPLGTAIQTRFSSEQHNSNEGRANLSALALSSMAEGSPIVGFGTTRDVQGSFLSIAVGSSGVCPGCSPPALGTQGLLWLIAFGTGFGGLVLFLGFILIQFLRNIRNQANTATMSLCVLLAYTLTLPFYDLGYTSLAALMAAISVLERGHKSANIATGLAHGDARASAPEGHAGLLLSKYARLARRQVTVLTGCALVGLASAGLWYQVGGVSYKATTSVLLPEEVHYPRDATRPMTLDTLAKIVQGSEATSSRANATRHDARAGSSDQLLVTAIPNTRVLNLSIVGAHPRAVVQQVKNSAQSLLSKRADLLRERQSVALSELDSQMLAISAGLHTLGAAQKARDTMPIAITEQHTRLLLRASELDERRSVVEHDTLDPGQVIRPATATKVTDERTVALTSGLMLGLLCGCVIASVRESRGARVSRRGQSSLPVLGRVTMQPAGARDVQPLLDSGVVDACLAVGKGDGVTAVAHRMSCLAQSVDCPAAERPLRVLLVVTGRHRWRQVERAASRLSRLGVSVAGVVVAEGK